MKRAYLGSLTAYKQLCLCIFQILRWGQLLSYCCTHDVPRHFRAVLFLYYQAEVDI